MSKKCGLLTNYQTDSKGKCVRYIACNITKNTDNPKCHATGQK